MMVKFSPSVLNGRADVPSSKSECIRGLILAALAGGTVKNVSFCDDVNAALFGLKAMGASCKISGNNVFFSAFNPFKTVDCTVDAMSCAATLRFLIPLALLSGAKIKFIGEEQLYKRPLSVYIKLFEENDISYELTENSLLLCGKLKNNEFKIRGDISSQFVSGLLMILPVINGKITVEGELLSAPYIEITKSVMQKFGVCVNEKNGVFSTVGEYKKAEYTVSADMTAAAYINAFSFLGGNVSVNGDIDTVQGDSVYIKIYESIENGEKSFDFESCPDLAPVVMAVCALKGGTYCFSGCRRLRFKESDRIFAMRKSLEKFGVKLVEKGDILTLSSDGLSRPEEPLESFEDHRIAMALSLLLLKTGGSIKGAGCVKKSFPDFFEQLKKCGADITI